VRKGPAAAAARAAAAAKFVPTEPDTVVGLYKLQVAHSLKAPGFNPRTRNVISWFQAFAFKMQLAPLHRGGQRLPVRRARGCAAGVH
jgi:hypothetical protein